MTRYRPICGPPGSTAPRIQCGAMDRAIRTAGVALALGFAAACSGKIHQFAPSAKVVCPGQPVKLTWKASGSTRLTAEPPLDGLGSVPEEGSRDVTITRSTLFTLSAARTGGTARRQQEVTLGEGLDVSIGEATSTCDASGVSATAVVAAEEWDDRLRIGTIDTSVLGRPITIERDGRTVDVGAAQTTDAFTGEKVSGTWIIRSPLRAGEQCGVQESGIPAALSFKVRVGCAASTIGPKGANP